MRWHALSVREQEIAEREASLAGTMKQLDQREMDVQLREQNLRQQELEILMEKQRVEQYRWRQRVPLTRADWDWRDAWAGDPEWEDGWCEGELDGGVDAEFCDGGLEM
jgi:hypothetical protein